MKFINCYLKAILFAQLGFFSFFSSIAAASGGWISSGGESFIYARNPWFVKNTQIVEYCLEMDEASFSISRENVEKLLVQGFDFWKNEFSTNRIPGKAEIGYADIATQTFTYLPKCQASTPLIFKLGLKKLDNEEIKFLMDPKKFIGVTIRKTYSLEQLRGSGTIYISADTGPDAYTNNGQMVESAWKSPILLRYALIHELGHFFGVPHLGSGIMSEVFMMVLLNKLMVKDFESVPPLSLLNPQGVFEVCQIISKFNPDFFQAPKDASCLKFELLPDMKPKWKVSVRSEGSPPYSYRELGTLQAGALDQSPYSMKPAVIVQLPDEQKVYRPIEKVAGPFLVGALFSDSSYTGSFVPKDSIRGMPLHMTLSAEKITIVGSVNNLQTTVMTYAPLSFLKAIFP